MPPVLNSLSSRRPVILTANAKVIAIQLIKIDDCTRVRGNGEHLRLFPFFYLSEIVGSICTLRFCWSEMSRLLDMRKKSSIALTFSRLSSKHQRRGCSIPRIREKLQAGKPRSKSKKNNDISSYSLYTKTFTVPIPESSKSRSQAVLLHASLNPTPPATIPSAPTTPSGSTPPSKDQCSVIGA